MQQRRQWNYTNERIKSGEAINIQNTFYIYYMQLHM